MKMRLQEFNQYSLRKVVADHSAISFNVYYWMFLELLKEKHNWTETRIAIKYN